MCSLKTILEFVAFVFFMALFQFSPRLNGEGIREKLIASWASIDFPAAIDNCIVSSELCGSNFAASVYRDI